MIFWRGVETQQCCTMLNWWYNSFLRRGEESFLDKNCVNKIGIQALLTNVDKDEGVSLGGRLDEKILQHCLSDNNAWRVWLLAFLIYRTCCVCKIIILPSLFLKDLPLLKFPWLRNFVKEVLEKLLIKALPCLINFLILS